MAELSSLEQGRAIVFATKHRPILAELEPVSYTHLDVYKRQTHLLAVVDS